MITNQKGAETEPLSEAPVHQARRGATLRQFKPLETFDHSRESFISLLPDKPYCTDSVGSRLLVRPREKAIEFAMIQHNCPMIWQLMVFDIDGGDAWFRAEERHCPRPTYISLNPANGHGHAVYLLESPVSAFEKSRRQAIRFYEDVVRGLTRKLGADRAYSGFLSKNPFSKRWETDWQAPRPYQLETLNDYLDKSDKRKSDKGEPSAIGRNVNVFDVVRAVAYRHCLKFKRDGRSLDEFVAFLRSAAESVNYTFAPPLHNAEIRGIIRSVAKWVWSKFTVERFSAIQSRRVRLRWTKAPAVSSAKPWIQEDISRATWYRRRQVPPSAPAGLIS